MSETVLH